MGKLTQVMRVRVSDEFHAGVNELSAATEIEMSELMRPWLDKGLKEAREKYRELLKRHAEVVRLRPKAAKRAS